ncbi:hypothetical protein [Vogesella sp. AC12]|uniref:hypothetical protein n=1 Tax=Vogesella sp. AC12 TaxID=2950550 RepID=UPI002108A083|nr:hypothetical protein [Vogesella sp. AC12]MCQ4145822.1 hypothetical protein [Vogesella sp. AC12]
MSARSLLGGGQGWRWWEEHVVLLNLSVSFLEMYLLVHNERMAYQCRFVNAELRQIKVLQQRIVVIRNSAGRPAFAALRQTGAAAANRTAAAGARQKNGRRPAPKGECFGCGN